MSNKHRQKMQRKFDQNMKKQLIKNSSTQIDEKTLKLEIREFLDRDTEIVGDPALELDLECSEIRDLNSYDYQLNPYLIYVSAVAQMQKLRLRDSHQKVEYFKKTFLEF